MVRIGSRTEASKRLKRYPGKSGSSTARLGVRRVRVCNGRNTSCPLPRRARSTHFSCRGLTLRANHSVCEATQSVRPPFTHFGVLPPSQGRLHPRVIMQPHDTEMMFPGRGPCKGEPIHSPGCTKANPPGCRVPIGVARLYRWAMKITRIRMFPAWRFATRVAWNPALQADSGAQSAAPGGGTLAHCVANLESLFVIHMVGAAEEFGLCRRRFPVVNAQFRI